MQIVYHLGAHCTDEDRLLKCLLKNRDTLAREGIVVPGPGRYRAVLRETMIALRGNPAPPDMQEMVLDAVMDDDHAERLVFSNQSFLAAPSKVLQRGRIYARAGERSHWLRQIFPEAACTLCLAVCNPATFLPALFARVRGARFDEFLAGLDPQTVRWSEVVAQIRGANPDARLVVWCNEDTPLIWPEVLRALAGHAAQTELEGQFDFLASIMSAGGLKRMQSYLESHPPASDMQRRRIVAAFLDRFAIQDEVEMELDVPGWTEAVVEEMTERYEEDVLAIERMEDVEFIAP